MTCSKIFTITCRGGRSLLFSNKADAKGKRHYQKFTANSSRNASLMAWIKILEIMPEDNSEMIAILLPSCVSFLAFKETRDFWLTNECTKTGEVIDDETLELVYKLNDLLEMKGDKVQNFSHSYVKAYKYKSEIALSWKFTNRIIPIEVVEATEIAEF